ncbi:MAG: TatD family hydrolase [Erysipelotrichaceae bacterium]|nr:TatD family hydrolase [Erysipelotrichaceae bacterium]
MEGIIDTHAHITADELYDRVDAIIATAKAAGVSKILAIAQNRIQCERALELTEKYDMIDVAMGLFPVDMPDLTERDFQDLEELAQDPHVVAIGEIGLDYYWDKEHKDIQKAGFIRQIKLAEQLNKPILVHMRDAAQDTLSILREHLKTGGIMHCYSGSVETAKEVLKIGMHVSFAGPVTFKNARGLIEVPKVVPLDRLFVETDSPYLTPHPLRGTQNEPKNVVLTFQKICELKQIEQADFIKAMNENYKNLFYNRDC